MHNYCIYGVAQYHVHGCLINTGAIQESDQKLWEQVSGGTSKVKRFDGDHMEVSASGKLHAALLAIRQKLGSVSYEAG